MLKGSRKVLPLSEKVEVLIFRRKEKKITSLVQYQGQSFLECRNKFPVCISPLLELAKLLFFF